MKTFRSNNVCGLKKVHVIALCREFSQGEYSESYGIFNEGYDESVCHRRMVFYARSPHLDSSHNDLITVMKCPPTYSTEENRKIFPANADYLSMGLEPGTFARYHRPNLKSKEIRLVSVIYKHSFDNLVQDERRIREFMKPGYILQLQREIVGETAPASLVGRPENDALQFIFHRNIVEDRTINFMKLKDMKKREYMCKISSLGS